MDIAARLEEARKALDETNKTAREARDHALFLQGFISALKELEDGGQEDNSANESIDPDTD